MGDQKDKAATRKTYIKKTSISKVLPKKCMSNAMYDPLPSRERYAI